MINLSMFASPYQVCVCFVWGDWFHQGQQQPNGASCWAGTLPGCARHPWGKRFQILICTTSIAPCFLYETKAPSGWREFVFCVLSKKLRWVIVWGGPPEETNKRLCYTCSSLPAFPAGTKTRTECLKRVCVCVFLIQILKASKKHSLETSGSFSNIGVSHVFLLWKTLSCADFATGGTSLRPSTGEPMSLTSSHPLPRCLESNTGLIYT